MKVKYWFIYIYMIVFLTLMGQSVLLLHLLDTESSNYYLYQIGLYSMSIILVLCNRRSLNKYPNIKILSLYFLFSFLFSLMNLEAFNIRTVVSIAFNTASMPLAMGVGVILSKQLREEWHDLVLVLYQLPALLNCVILLSYPYGTRPDAIFSIFVFLPFCFLFHRKWLSYIFLIIYLLAVLLTAKRSIILTYSICVSLFVIYNTFVNKYQKLWKRYLLIFFAIAMGAYYVSSKVEYIEGVKERFERLEDNESNGRDEIIIHYSNRLSESDSFELLFGHGYAAVVKDIGKGAHNDMLEILYDYGVIVYFIYICFGISTLNFYYKNYKKDSKSEYSFNTLLICLVIFMVGIFNCISNSNLYVYVLFLILGISMNEVQKKFEHQST